MKLKKLLTSLLLAVVAIGFTACDNSDDDATMQVSNIVTYMGTNGSGQSVFYYQELNDAEGFNIVSNTGISSDVIAGTRLLIIFTIPAGTTLQAGTVVDLQYATSVTTLVPILGDTPDDLGSIYLQSIFRSGTWLNLSGLVGVTSESNISVIVKESSLETSTVEMYLVLSEASSATSTQWYGTINIAQYWNDSRYEQIIIRMNNTNGDFYYTFSK